MRLLSLPSMTIAFISDLHLTPQWPESNELFMSFLRNAEGLIEELYILGDLFEYWVGDDASDRLGHEEVETAIKMAARSGIRIYFIHGNRDFLVGSAFAQRTGCTILLDPSVILLDETRVLLSHGDSLCTDDIKHQESRKQILSIKWKMAFLEQSVDHRIATAEFIRSESELAKKNKSADIMDVNQSAVEHIMQAYSVNIMIHGHTHRPAVHEFFLTGCKSTRYVLGDWYKQKSVLIYDNGAFLLKR